MNAKVISIYAADTSGVCSALYELGGMTVVHDASGCNSTYATHDEPRWYDRKSMIYISALTEADAVMGNDGKFICDVKNAAKELSPLFIALCGSPMPAMTGFDYSAAAEEIERETGLTTFYVDTNGTHSYLHGAEGAFLKLVKLFCHEKKKTQAGSVNIIGATPLDFSVNTSVSSIKKWLSDNGFSVKSGLAMDSSLEDISSASEAAVSLVISSDGIAAAEYLFDTYGVPYVVGVPVGKSFSKKLSADLKRAASEGVCINSCGEKAVENAHMIVTGESVFSSSLGAELGAKTVATVGIRNSQVLSGTDIFCEEEEQLERLFSQHDIVIADPLFKPICKGSTFVSLPHVAFSGRCFLKDIPDLIDKGVSKILNL